MKAVVICAAERSAHGAIAAASRLASQGAGAVLVQGVDTVGGRLHWLHTQHARGWLQPVVPATEPTPASALALERQWAAVRARGFVAADAALLAVSGPQGPLAGLSWGESVPAAGAPASSPVAGPMGIYAIVDGIARLRQVLGAGVSTVQLRIKQPHDADAAWHAALRRALQEGSAAAAGSGALLFINDHWRLAAEVGAGAVHLGQEDLEALGESGRRDLQGSGLALGISSHAVWELCRARTLAPRYIACGPVWPTTTKAMPWRPQGLHNLAWWRRTAEHPVVAIGGILEAEQVEQAARSGAAGVCVVRGLGDDPRAVLPALQQAFARGHAASDSQAAPEWPQPSLEPAPA